VGLVKGVTAISQKTVLTILAGWALTPVLAGLTSFGLYVFLNAMLNLG
jgi:phosphate/sulfate permease